MSQHDCCGGADRPAATTDPSAPAPDEIRQQVRDSYGRVADSTAAAGGCCAPGEGAIQAILATRLGYSAAELASLPEGANLGLGCGNPQALAALRPGEVVLDLGSGAGGDCFLAAAKVGDRGWVIGVDMTPEMLSRARANALRGGYTNVEFRLGEIEHLPLADASVDVIISNCVINLSPDKPRVFAEAFRVLRPGGRLAVSDVVATTELPPELRADPALYAGCVAGAATVAALQAMLATAGFGAIAIEPKDGSRAFIKDWAPGRGVEDYVVSANIAARKPV